MLLKKVAQSGPLPRFFIACPPEKAERQAQCRFQGKVTPVRAAAPWIQIRSLVKLVALAIGTTQSPM
jgi:hypothetical protein